MNEFLQIIRQTQVPIPTIEILALLVILTLSLAVKSTRVGLLMAFAFVYRWGWLFFNETFPGHNDSYFLGYLICGALVFLLSLIVMFISRE
jgi:hypothetical protein